MSIQIKSFNQILGDMIRTIIAETPLNDLNAGSVLLTLLEAAAANDFENNAAILNVLELLNIDAVKNNDLDDRAADYGLTRFPAIKASGLVNILNTNIVKQSTGLYVIKPAPIAGQMQIFVNNTTGWAPTGTLYIGRGTQTFEGPIPYSGITNNVTYFTITLGSALQRNHLISDLVVNSQGQPDQNIAAGTIVNIPANNQNPEVQYVTLRDAVIPSGEVEVDGVGVIALVPGSQGNAGINTITSFDTAPFTGAAVTNTSAFSNGTDVETDDQLRNRIKSYATTLARGTASSILSAVIGVSDPDDSKQVASAVISEPVEVGDPSILYIDDGFGLQPSFAGQSVDIMLTNATGKEKFLQLANFPVPRPQVINTQTGPFNLESGSFLRVVVDGAQEDIVFTTSQFLNIAAATIAEIIVVINENSTLVNARFVNNSQFVLIYPINHAAEIIQVAPIAPTDNVNLYSNSLLKFPTNEFSYIALYRNATRLHEKAKSATVETTPFASWNITSTGDLVISVDNTPTQDQSFALSDFVGASSFASLTLQDWVTVFNMKFAGLTATATSSQTMIIVSNQVGNSSAINVEGGTLLAKLFPNLPLTSVGQTSDFKLNRQTGNLEVFEMFAGDTISAGVVDAKGFDISAVTSSGTYDIGSDSVGRPAEMIVVADSNFCDQRSISLLIGSTFDITNSSSVMRIMSSAASTWESLLPGDFIYITKRTSGWFDPANCGLYKIIDKGANITPGTDTFVDVKNSGGVDQASVSVLDSLDIKAFGTDGFPQIWRGIYVNNPPAALITDIVASLNKDLINVRASIYNSNSIKVTSTTETGGSIAIPVAVSNANVLFAETKSAQFGNPPHIANRTSARNLVGLFKRTAPTASHWLNRYTYSDLKGSLSANAVPDSFPFAGTYSEVLTSPQLAAAKVSFDDYVSFTRGNNRNQFRNVKALPGVNQVGTQEGTARTELDHITGDEFQLVRPLQISTDDSIVFIMDENQTDNTIDIQMARTGQINGGYPGTFIPTNTEFSARDADNEPNITFSNTVVWGTSIQNTDFSDYAVWMQARNWYASGGVGSGNGVMILRSAQFGPNGNSLQFSIAYPNSINQTATTTYLNTPSFSQYTYFFGSGAKRATTINSGYTIAVSNASGNYWNYTFSAGVTGVVTVGDILSITTGSGVSAPNSGQFKVSAISGNQLTVFNPNAVTNPTEIIANANAIAIFPLLGTTTTAIAATINTGLIMTAVALPMNIGLGIGTDIIKATGDEDYTYVSDATALAHGHNPTVPATRGSVAMYDGEGWVKTFENSDPNFILKNTLVLQGVSSVYSMDTAPNVDSTVGEYFKLIPTTVKNIYHQFTQPALSQLPIIANVSITDDRKNVQVDSKVLGSAGAVEIVGGNANRSQAYIVAESEIASDTNGSNLLVKIPAFPDTFNVGDFVMLQNDTGVRRLSRLAGTDTISVTIPSANNANYNYNPKAIGVSNSSTFTITDVSGSYSLASGFVWRWTNDSADATFALVNPGDQVFAFGSTIPWDQGNKPGMSGDGEIAGLPIVAVNDGAHWIDVVNPHGKLMGSSAIGAGNTVQICPTPAIRWNLAHASRVSIVSMSRSGSTVSVTTDGPHYLNTGDSVDIADSNFVPDASYVPVTVLTISQFTFSLAGSVFSESNAGSNMIKTGVTPTRYRIEKLGFNGMTRISANDGASPMFVDSGVAVDDYVAISGNTFAANNNGVYRVTSLDNTSIMLVNDNASDQLNTIHNFNNQSLEPTWTANTNVLTGVAGTFKYVSVGDWIKKSADSDSLLLQVTSISPSAGPLATTVVLGGNYGGSTAIAPGVFYDELNDHDKGVFLQSADDITIYEGDAALAGDLVSAQNIINAGWFNVTNIGNFTVTAVGTDSATYKPYIKVVNPASIAQANVNMSVNTAGFYITESLVNKYYSVRQITHAALDDISPNNRSLYMKPDDRSYKFSNANATSVLHQGKLGYSTDVTTGIDGYLYYTGILRRVQRIVDGFEPDPLNYPGRRAVGGLIETLPPLVKRIHISVNITTGNGVNLGDITNNIKSVIINYVQGLGVGQDVILSEIIAQVMNITGVVAVTFTNPVPSTERITIGFNERADIIPEDIGIA